MYSGERILPKDIFNVTYQQSLLAYEFAAQFVAGKRVLDVAFGEGYGASLLGKNAKQVVGVDYHAVAVAEAQKRYGSAHVSFLQGDLFQIADVLKGDKFDVVCCFQTIEHVEDHDRFLAALTSVTKPGGKIIVSTPNTNVFHSFNPYHVHEVDYSQWQDLWARNFSQYETVGVFGDESVMRYRQGKQKISDFLLGLDFLRAREWLPRPIVMAIYGLVSLFVIKRFSLWQHYDQVVAVTTKNFFLRSTEVDKALDFVTVATVEEEMPVVSGPPPRRVSWQQYVVGVIFVLALFVPRMVGLDAFFTQDEQPWMNRAQVYWNAISHLDLAAAVQYPLSNHPAIPLMTTVGPALNVYGWYYGLDDTYESWSWPTKAAAAGVARYAWGVVCSLALLAVFFMLKRLEIFAGSTWQPMMIVVLLGLEPWIWGISRAVSVDVMMGIGLVGAFVAAALARQYKTPIWLFLSGAWLGLAFVSKSPALITAPYIFCLAVVMAPWQWRALLKRSVLWVLGAYVAMVVIWPPFLLHPWQRLTDVLARVELHSTVQEIYLISDSIMPFFLFALSTFSFVGVMLYVLFRLLAGRKLVPSLLLFDVLLLAGAWHGLILVWLHGDHARKNLPALALLTVVGAMGWILLLRRLKTWQWQWAAALVGIQLALVGSYWPHVMTAHNVFLTTPGMKRMLVDIGNGSRLLADYIQAHESQVYATPMDSLMAPYLTKEARVRMRELPSEGDLSVLSDDVTHVVVSASLPARVSFDSQARGLLEAFKDVQPEAILSVRDVPMFFVYKITR